uniref:transmembrane protein 266 n=1 Tax=Myxine glutinosa TaxID=7769 RepID=UPI00358F3D22
MAGQFHLLDSPVQWGAVGNCPPNLLIPPASAPPPLPSSQPPPSSPEEEEGESGRDSEDSTTWNRPCCGQRGSQLWLLLLTGFRLNVVLLASVAAVSLLLTAELLLDTQLVRVHNAKAAANTMHWLSFLILTLFFVESVCRMVVIGVAEYIENKLEVFDGAVIVLAFAPMVASTVANGPESAWDALSLVVTLRAWRLRQVLQAYVLPLRRRAALLCSQFEYAASASRARATHLALLCHAQALEIERLRGVISELEGGW